ncbi:MAG: hypothetical protein H6641_25085 [Caldilineaceae bacterium]|nr:hypothetical protein [Caldilineaceae bacterium]
MSEPYVNYAPGQLIAAEVMNDMQMQIRDDIEAKVAAAKDELVENGVSRADNADKFAEKSETEWTKVLDERYAPKVHDHEGQGVYRRYFKRFTSDTPNAFLHHKLGRFPLVDTYQLLAVPNTSDVDATEHPVRFFLYYAHEEADRFNLNAKVFRERVPVGIPIAALLDEYAVDWEEDDTLQDVRNELWDGLFKLPNDEMGHAASPWLEEKCIERLKIKDLIENDEWPDIRLAFEAQKIEVIPENSLTTGNDNQRGPVVKITHINYETLMVEVDNVGPNADAGPLDLMFLLRM